MKILPVSALFLSSLAALASCGERAAKSASQPVPVRVRLVEKTASDLDARYSGTLECATKVDMMFRVGGYVETIGELEAETGKRRPVEMGTTVTQGTVLARVRSQDYAQRVVTADATVAEATASMKLAELQLTRVKDLLKREIGAEADVDRRTAEFDSAKATLEAAVSRAREAAIALADCVLVAPMDGVVLARHVEVGSLVSPGSLAFTVADTKTLKAIFGAPQSLIERLQIGGTLLVHAGREQKLGVPPLEAKVARISPAADASGRVFKVESLLANESGALWPGSVVSIQVPHAAAAADTIIVPLTAVVRSPRDPRGFAVFVLDGNGTRAPARLRDVVLGDVLGNGVAVASGLALGQRVVTVGATLLRDGQEAVVIP